MRYDRIVEYFSNEEGIVKLLNELKKEYFDVIDDYNGQLLSEVITTSGELQKAKTTLTTIVSSLEPIYSKALSLKKQDEYSYCVAHKDDGSAAYVDKAAKASVKLYRDVRDIVRGYLNSANALLFDCKDRIENNRKEYVRTEK